MQTQRGSCHCGNVAFEFDAPVTGIMECNCSICHRKGALWHAVSDAQFRIVSGEESLTTYQFGTHTAKHFFCSQCGTSTFSNPRIARTRLHETSGHFRLIWLTKCDRAAWIVRM